jgi:hypothetical protein
MRRRCRIVILAAALCGLASLNMKGAAPMRQTAQIKTVKDRVALADPRSWTEGVVKLLIPGTATTAAREQTVSVRNVNYSSRTVGLGLALLVEPTTKVAYVVHSEQSFYVSRPQGVVSCIVAGGSVNVRDSVFRMPPTSRGETEVLASFVAATSDDQLLTFFRQSGHIDIRPGIPHSFWTARGGLDSQPALPRIEAIDLRGDVLRLDLAGGGKQKGTFWVDMAVKRVTRTLLDGREVFAVK